MKLTDELDLIAPQAADQIVAVLPHLGRQGRRLVMRPAARRQWLLDRLRASPVPLDILDADFVDAFIEATQAPFIPANVGAHRCPTLGRDLAVMYRNGDLCRQPVGVPCGEWGMPRWVYAYGVVS